MLNAQDWIIKNIKRNGIFKTDPRYSNELLLKELIGHDGNNQNKFIGFAESTHFERMKEIKMTSLYSLSHSHQWTEFINSVYDELQPKSEKYRFLIDIYNPDSLITSFYFTMSEANPDYLPLYRIFVDYIDSPKTEIYIGELYWNNKLPTAKIFYSTNILEIGDKVLELHTDPDNEKDSIEMALIYTNRKITIIDSKTTYNNFVKTINNRIEIDNTLYRPVEDYIIYNKEIISKMLLNYNSTFQKM